MKGNRSDERPTASILHFPRRRGRPPSRRLTNDTGTPELVMKRVRGETAEALDICFERKLITPEMHWCGIHLRWLYTLRYGAPGVRALDPTHLGGTETKPDDPEWRSLRENEYHEAVTLLHKRGYRQIILSLCIYNERPCFLDLSPPITARRSAEAMRSIDQAREGLAALATHWNRQPQDKNRH